MNKKLLTLIVTSSILTACGSDSAPEKNRPIPGSPTSSISSAQAVSQPASSAGVSSSATSSSQASSVAALQGVFIDSPVAGIRYTTTSFTADDQYTDAQGVFNYAQGDTVTFYLGNRILGSATAQASVSPLDLANASDFENTLAINIARLLQTLDSDSDTPGLQIPPLPNDLPEIDFSVDPDIFGQQAAVTQLIGSKPLVGVDEALQHLAESLDRPFSRTTLNCAALTSYYCEDFSLEALGWSLNPETNNESVPNGEMAWKKIAGNGMLMHTAASKGGVVALLDSTKLAGVTGADYSVEARFRPRMNGTTGNKQLYLLTRYIDGKNWYGGVLNVQNDPAATNVEIAKSVNGSISRPLQVKRPIVQGTRDGTDGVWYNLRIDAVGNTLTVYLDGELIGSWTDANAPFLEKGTIGIWTANKSFEFDDVRIFDPAEKPVSLTLDYKNQNYNAEAGDAPLVVSVDSRDQQNAAAGFTAVSDNPAVVSVEVVADKVTLTPLAAGTANITFTSSLNTDRKRVITAEIAPAFTLSTTTYDLTNRVIPEASALEVYEDQILSLQFDKPVTLGSYGLVRIYNADTNALVDTLTLVGDKDSLGGAAVGTNLRTINTHSIRADGQQLVIAPHAGKLLPNTRYRVAIGAGVVLDNSIGGVSFDGLGTSAWSFSTRAAAVPAGLERVVVDDNGNTAHFRRVQSALDYAMSHPSVTEVEIKSGIYSEPLYLRNRNDLKILGEDRDTTIVRYSNNNKLNPSTDGRALFLISGGDNIALENFTLHNSTLIGDGGQAETLYFNSDAGRLTARQMNFFSEQDTILVKGWSWFYDSLIAGNVDFIWGYPKAALFEKSEIRTLGDSRGNGNGGYILQARVNAESDKGFVFLNSRLTQGVGPAGHQVEPGKTYLARSGGDTKVFDNIVFVNTKMDTHIAAIGWAGKDINNQPAPTPAVSTSVSGWREYNSMNLAGGALDVSSRQTGINITLADVQAAFCSRAQVFQGFNNGAGWNPMPEDASDCINPSAGEVSSSSSHSVSSAAVVSSSSSESSESLSSASSSSATVGDASSSSSSSSSSGAAGTTTTVINFTTSVPTSLLAAAPAAGNTNFSATASPVSALGLIFYSRDAGRLRYSINNDKGSINYNGASFQSDLTAATDVSVGTQLTQFSNLIRYIAIPVTVTASSVDIVLNYANASKDYSEAELNGCLNGLVILTDQVGRVLKTASACGVDYRDMTLRVTDETVTHVYVLMTRAGDGGGGIRVENISITQ